MQSAKPVERGGCLTAFLIFMMIVNPLTGLYYFVAGSQLQQVLPDVPSWSPAVLGLLSFANLAFAIGIWKWKKWGVYGFIASATLAFLFNTIYVGIGPAIFGLIGLGVLLFLLRDAWHALE